VTATLQRTRLIGSTTPRLYTPPLVQGRPGPCTCGCALTPATSAGFGAVTFATEVAKVELLPWQRWLLIHALELRPGGRFRFRTVLLLISRQNGKGRPGNDDSRVDRAAVVEPAADHLGRGL
jgi:hypothetical protein